MSGVNWYVLKVRREKVKSLVLGGFTIPEIQEQLGLSYWVVKGDIKSIGLECIEESEKIAENSFFEFANKVDWAQEEAHALHTNNPDLNALKFIVDSDAKKLAVAQSLGLLELAAEKKVIETTNKVDSGIIKMVGDLLATRKKEK